MVIYGYTYALGLVAGGGVLTWLVGWPWGVPFYILALFCLNFFRDPEREVPAGAVAVSPADGKVTLVNEAPGGSHRVSIFLNVFDVHVNRTPIPGKLICINYKKGEFRAANYAASSEVNEQNVLTVEGVVGGRTTQIKFSQIAGLIARRIICYKKTGDVVGPAERIGLIKFGSRVDMWMGPEWAVTVKVGDKVQAGSSVIARMAEERLS
ncbi:MAG TPA: phosphatidylserine decarboxylase [Bryobacteraceae bacterium]|jgi:phosphatidylserine decarboxylase